MAKDDYHVIVYQILAYLYNQLKHGAPIDKQMIECESPLFANINKQYWSYIVFQMAEMGLITGVAFVPVDGLDIPYACQLEKCMITPKGIEYLTDNSFMAKAKEFLKDVREIVPFP